jgi:rare lipoprotein A
LVIGGVALAHHRTFRGRAQYYANVLEGNPVACGGRYHRDEMTAAHRRLPCGTVLRVKNMANGSVVKVTVTDRGPFDPVYVLDLSRRAARKLGYLDEGSARVKATVIHR